MTSKIQGSTVEEIRESLAIAMTKMASQGSVPAAQAASKMIDELELREISENHKAQLDELKTHPNDLCQYLGYIGESETEISRHLGREPDEGELNFFLDGIKDRQLEIKAIEIAFAKRTGKIHEWMRR
jgi:hypothetical protein